MAKKKPYVMKRFRVSFFIKIPNEIGVWADNEQEAREALVGLLSTQVFTNPWGAPLIVNKNNITISGVAEMK